MLLDMSLLVFYTFIIFPTEFPNSNFCILEEVRFPFEFKNYYQIITTVSPVYYVFLIE